MVDEEDRGTAAPASPTVAEADLLKQRNRILALSLAGVSALALVVAVTLQTCARRPFVSGRGKLK